MFRIYGSLLTVVFLLSTAANAGKKHPEIQLLDFKAERTDALISVHAKVKNTSERPLQRINLILRFLDTGNATVTTQRAPLDTLELKPGEESEVDAQMKDAPRAVWVLVLADRSGGIELPVADNGPYSVE